MSKKEILLIIICVIISYGLSLLVTALVIKGICWAFDIDFSMKIAIGIWLILSLLSGFFLQKRRD